LISSSFFFTSSSFFLSFFFWISNFFAFKVLISGRDEEGEAVEGSP